MAPGIREATYKFICSDKHPSTPRTLEDIDRLLASSGIKVLREMSSHYKDPETTGKLQRTMLIETNLDNPNLDDKFISNAEDVHEEETSKQQLKMINEKFQQENKQKLKTDSSNADSDRLKMLDENKTTMKVGTVERA